MKDILGIVDNSDELVEYLIQLCKYGNVLIMAACVFAVIYGIIRFFKGSEIDFPKILIVAICCDFFRAFFVVSSIWAGNEFPLGYNTSTLGLLAVFLFLAFQSVSLPEYKINGKKKIFPFAMFAAVVASAFCVFFANADDVSLIMRIIIIIWGALVSLCIYTTASYSVSEDDEKHLIAAYRPTNITIIVFVLSCLIETYMLVFFDYEEASVIFNISLMLDLIAHAVCVFLLPILLYRGLRKWQI